MKKKGFPGTKAAVLHSFQATVTVGPAGQKGDAGKLNWWLFAPLWKPLELVVRVLEHGKKTYGAHNWQTVKDDDGGPPFHRYGDALMRHVAAFQRGEWLDDDPKGSGLPHLACIICNALFLLWFGDPAAKK